MRGSDRGQRQGAERLTVYPGGGDRDGGGRAYVRDDFSPPASIAIPVEDYQAVRIADLKRIRDRMAEAPRETVGWAATAWGFVSLAGGAATTAVALDPNAAVPPFALWLVAAGLLVVALICGLAHFSVNEERRRTKDDLIADMDETVAHLEAAKRPREAR
ncbi:MAG TPA: hypothetical protein VII45_11690 [Solirubrobacterales bacterium]